MLTFVMQNRTNKIMEHKCITEIKEKFKVLSTTEKYELLAELYFSMGDYAKDMFLAEIEN